MYVSADSGMAVELCRSIEQWEVCCFCLNKYILF